VVQLLMLAGADPTILNAKGMLAEQEASPAVAAIIRAGAVQPEVLGRGRNDERMASRC